MTTNDLVYSAWTSADQYTDCKRSAEAHTLSCQALSVPFAITLEAKEAIRNLSPSSNFVQLEIDQEDECINLVIAKEVAQEGACSQYW